MATKKPTKDNVNNLARKFYEAHGNRVPDGYDFSEAHHPQEVSMWNLACGAFAFITGSAPDMVDGRKRLEERFGGMAKKD